MRLKSVDVNTSYTSKNIVVIKDAGQYPYS